MNGLPNLLTEYMITRDSIFSDRGRFFVQSTWLLWKRIYTEWLPASGYDLADMPIIECHYPPDHTPATALWVPLITT